MRGNSVFGMAASLAMTTGQALGLSSATTTHKKRAGRSTRGDIQSLWLQRRVKSMTLNTPVGTWEMGRVDCWEDNGSSGC
mmetsp:Transcript_11609/g.25447  ORF Transcript_11609/g.25447 Transcript_11609/m.25447 type:complete len:80 (+) Transcript_11609:278-517(+)